MKCLRQHLALSKNSLKELLSFFKSQGRRKERREEKVNNPIKFSLDTSNTRYKNYSKNIIYNFHDERKQYDCKSKLSQKKTKCYAFKQELLFMINKSRLSHLLD